MILKKLSKKQKPKKIVLAVGAHPDDIDIGCSGTISKIIQDGGEAFYLVLTDGSKGSEDSKISDKKLTKLRHAEQENAAKILGVKKVFFQDFVDGELENTPELRKQIVKIIRQVKPETVICFDPTLVYDENRRFINHPDHRVCGQATLDAIFPYARNVRSFPELLAEGLEPHVVEEVLLVNFGKHNFYVDISKTVDLKMKAISCHKSQFRDIEKFQERIKQMSAMLGKKSQPKAKYAEAFFRITLRQPS
ncbi:PIG-L family deacetylase [Candidatus Daviesbacteria bacterium]|nr:PIG-L family deacetylase [Candidatus Daviesbacteria bacterium]